MANQVAWTGADGNLYWRQGDQVINSGAATNYEFVDGGLRATNFDTPLGQASGFAPGVDQIADPNAPQTAPVRSGTGTTPAVQTAAATTGLTDTGAVVTATGDAAGAVGDLVGVHWTADAEIRA